MPEKKYFNAHCHLEYGNLLGRIPPGLPFVEWLELILGLKRQETPESSRQAARRGIERLRETGTEVIADVLALDTSAEPLLTEAERDPAFRALMFWEMIDFDPATSPLTMEMALKRLESHSRGLPNVAHGLAPHAPYTTTGDLLEESILHGRHRDQWVCIHAAETEEERQLMLHGQGPLYEFLMHHGVLPEDWEPPGTTPVRWLEMCGCLGPKTLLVHCNAIDDGEIRLIRDRGCRVVVCPGTHIYFRRRSFPLERLLMAGIPVYLGTDSLASNDDLNMEREVALAMQLARSTPKDRIEALASVDRAIPFFLTRSQQK